MFFLSQKKILDYKLSKIELELLKGRISYNLDNQWQLLKNFNTPKTTHKNISENQSEMFLCFTNSFSF